MTFIASASSVVGSGRYLPASITNVGPTDGRLAVVTTRAVGSRMMRLRDGKARGRIDRLAIVLEDRSEIEALRHVVDAQRDAVGRRLSVFAIGDGHGVVDRRAGPEERLVEAGRTNRDDRRRVAGHDVERGGARWRPDGSVTVSVAV